MEYSITWLQAPWLFSLVMQGTLTLEEHAAMVADQMRYLDGADGRLYWIYDLRKVSMTFSGPIFAAVSDSPIQFHTHTGMLSFIASSTLARFLATTAVQRPRRTEAQVSSPIHVFPTFEEARTFNLEVGALDPKRATVCTPKEMAT